MPENFFGALPASLLCAPGGGSLSSKETLVDALGEKTVVLRLCSLSDGAAAHVSTVVDLAFARRLVMAPGLTPAERAEALRTRFRTADSAVLPLEVLLHAAVPAAVVLLVHAPALLAAGELGQVGAGVMILPPPADPAAAARAVAEILETQAGLRAIIFRRHGTVIWGETAQETAEVLRSLLAEADQPFGPATIGAGAHLDAARARLISVLPVIRGLLAQPTGDQDLPFNRVILRALCTPEMLGLLAAEKAREASGWLSLCAAHSTHLGAEALWLESADQDDPNDLRERLSKACGHYAEKYGGARPRVVLLPGLGAVCAGESASQADRAAELLLPAMRAGLRLAAAGPAAEVPAPLHPAGPFRPLPLAGHVSLVTGAAGAIGAGICRGLLQAGSHVAVTDLPGERLDSLVEELREIDANRVIGVPLDVTDPASVSAGLQRTVATWGGVDLAVINAGVAHVSTLEKMDLEAFRRLERINVEGALLLLREMAQHFRLQGTGGDVVLISTKNVPAPGASFGAYSATKAAAHQLARIASLELAELGVRVNMVAPDAVFGEGARKSGLWQEIGPERMKARGLDEQGLEEYYRTRNLLKARVTPEHVARAVLFFATRQTPTTGATLPVDGGLPDAVPR